MPIEVHCPNPVCARIHHVKNRYAGMRGHCPACKAWMYVPTANGMDSVATPPTGTQIRITGLPFTCEATNYHPVNFGYISQLLFTAGIIQLTAVVEPGTSRLYLTESFNNAGGGSYPAANFTNVNADLYFSGVYRV